MDREWQVAVAEERRRVRELRVAVDLTTALLRQAPLGRDEAVRIVNATRGRALKLFPGAEGTFDLILAPRFRRFIDERFGRQAGAEVLPFPGPRRT